MDAISIGIIIAVIGTSVTFLTLYLLMLLIKLLSRMFPYKENADGKN
jgi:hypothetical protein